MRGAQAMRDAMGCVVVNTDWGMLGTGGLGKEEGGQGQADLGDGAGVVAAAEDADVHELIRRDAQPRQHLTITPPVCQVLGFRATSNTMTYLTKFD